MSEPSTIAIVDDDPAVREALGELLRAAGLPSRAFAGAAAFLAEHGARGFGVVVTDLRMPQLDGIELLRRLGATGNPPWTIVVTSSIDAATRARVLETGAMACLTKPVDGDALLQLVITALEQIGADPQED